MSSDNQPGLFDFINALTSEKTDILTNDQAVSAYSPWVIDIAFSQTLETIHYANLVNCLRLSKSAHYAFYKGILPKRRIYGKWAKKPAIDENVEAIATEILKWPKRRAKDISMVLDNTQMQSLLTRLEKGGKV